MLEDKTLVGVSSGQRFPIRKGIPSFVSVKHTPRRNRFWQWLYDRVAFAYDFVLKVGPRINYGTEQKVRQEYIANLEIESGAKILEVGVGSADNFQFLPVNCDCYGLDISWNMLLRAQRNLTTWGRSAQLFHADGQYIPFHDNTFDLVFQMAVLQHYADPFIGIREMARTTKPGAAVIVIDEVSAAQRTFKRLPAHAQFARDKASALEALPRLVPHGMRDIKAEILPSGEFYALEFRKPT